MTPAPVRLTPLQLAQLTDSLRELGIDEDRIGLATLVLDDWRRPYHERPSTTPAKWQGFEALAKNRALYARADGADGLKTALDRAVEALVLLLRTSRGDFDCDHRNAEPGQWCEACNGRLPLTRVSTGWYNGPPVQFDPRAAILDAADPPPRRTPEDNEP